MGRLQIEILTEDFKLTEICQQYWRSNEKNVFVFKVQEVAKKHKISSRALLDIVNQNSIAMDKYKHCDDCKKAFVYKNRQHYVKNAVQSSKYLCISCSSARCEREDKLVQDMLVKVQQQSPITISDLGYEKAIYLYAYLSVNCTGRNIANITEDINLTGEIVHDFIRSSILIPGSVEDMLFLTSPFTSEELIRREWILNQKLGEIEAVLDMIEAIYLNHSQEIYRETYISMCYEVALRECLRYLDYKLKKRKFEFNYAEGTKAVILQGLEHFSVAQMYNLIYQAVYRSTESYQKQHLTKRFAGRLTVSILRQRIEYYLDSEYPVKPFNRLKDHPRSVISLILFDQVLEKNNCGFKEILLEIV